MKQNIIMIIVLVALFFFGLLIYDFSDEMDKNLTNHNWYTVENDSLDVLSFSNNKFSYYEEDSGNAVDDYDLCSNYKYNRSINVIKLNCNVDDSKLYITSYDDKTLKISFNKQEKVFYSTEDLAYINDFKNANELSDSEYNNLLNIDLLNYKYSSVDDIVKTYKSKKTKYVAFIDSKITYKNVLNYQALNNLISESGKTIYTMTTDDINSVEAKRLHAISKKFSEQESDYLNNEIKIYQIGNKKVKLISTIDVQNIAEVKKYYNI